MQRYILTLGGIPYLVEYIKSSERTIKHIQEYVMLRRYEIVNDIAIDKEIYFAALDKYKDYIQRNSQGIYEEADSLVFPYKNGEYENISSTILDFIPDASLRTLKYNSEIDDVHTDYYNLFVKNSEEQYERIRLESDIIRIYRPHSRKHINSIITISNIINNIQFYYFCEKYESQKIHISKEIKYNNNYYYEYIEIYVPNMHSLFGKKDIYYNEDLNFYQISRYANDNIILNVESNKILLRNLILPYRIEKACTRKYDCIFCEKYIYMNCNLKQIKNDYIRTFLVDDIDSTEYTHSEYNFDNIPFILTMSHYDEIDTTSKHYLSLSGISPSSIVFSENNQFNIKSEISFDNNNRSVISVICRWDYPSITNEPIFIEFDDEELENNKELNNKLTSNKTLEISPIQQAYFYYNKISNIKDYYLFDDYDDDSFLYGFSDELIESLNFMTCGCLIEMALDNRFENVFYRRSAGMTEGIDDFSFNLDNIFYSWKEYPEVIFVRTMFIDKFLSKVFFSNIMTLTKEKFKYCINDTFKNYRINLNSMTTFNFIDKINCTINRHDIMKENVITIGNNSGKSSIVYKPIFYRTHDTNKIKIRQGVMQNIGINLGEYLSKVENFKMKLDEYEFVEYARNDVYVIFKIPATYLSSTNGKYDILDADDDTYITSGDYELI